MKQLLAPEHAPSYWAATARHACAFPALGTDIEADVAIIGGGFTGLSTAHHLQKAGQTCVVLEANQVGWGASGRNGGMAVPRYKLTFPELERKYGTETALLMHRTAHEAVDTLEAIVGEYSLDCAFARYGHLTPVVNPVDITRFEADVRWLEKNAGDRTPRMLDAGEASARIGTAFYKAAYFEPRGAGIHPLEYCQALANSLASRNVGIYCDTPVESWSPEAGGVVVHTARARVKARHLVIATNGYTDLTHAGDQLKKRVVPVASALIATEPLSASLRAQILPQANLATDAKRLTNYYRVMPDGRFVFGGRGGASSQASERVYRRLAKDMAVIFPQPAGVSLDQRWHGLVAATPDFFPPVGGLSPVVSSRPG